MRLVSIHLEELRRVGLFPKYANGASQMTWLGIDFPSTFNGDLGDLNSSASDNNFSWTGLALLVLISKHGQYLSFPEDASQSSSSTGPCPHGYNLRPVKPP